jgi:hypothetical protein
MPVPKIDLNPSPVEIDQFARSTARLRKQMFDAARANGGGNNRPSPSETAPTAEEFDRLSEAVETLAQGIHALRNSVCVIPREAVTGTRSRRDQDQDQDQDKPSRLGNDRPNIRPIRASEKRLSRSPSIRPIRESEERLSRQPETKRGREAEEYVTSAEENRRAGRPRSGNEPIGYSKKPYEEQPNEEDLSR